MTFFDALASHKKNLGLPRIDTEHATVPYVMSYTSDYSPPNSTLSRTSEYASFTSSPFYAQSLFPTTLTPFLNQFSPLSSPHQGTLISPYTSPLSQKNFQCGFCEKSYIRSHDLKRHQRQHHFGGERFPCPKCDSLFSRSDALKRHVKDDRCVKKRERRLEKAKEKAKEKAMRGGWVEGDFLDKNAFNDDQQYSGSYAGVEENLYGSMKDVVSRNEDGTFMNSGGGLHAEMFDQFTAQTSLDTYLMGQPELRQSLALLVDGLITADNTPSPVTPYNADDEATPMSPFFLVGDFAIQN